jgi:hypothetical protein
MRLISPCTLQSIRDALPMPFDLFLSDSSSFASRPRHSLRLSELKTPEPIYTHTHFETFHPSCLLVRVLSRSQGDLSLR